MCDDDGQISMVIVQLSNYGDLNNKQTEGIILKVNLQYVFWISMFLWHKYTYTVMVSSHIYVWYYNVFWNVQWIRSDIFIREPGNP